MPAVFHVTATAMCPHGGTVSTISANTRVLVNGLQAAVKTDAFPVAACAFNVSGSPHPCVEVKWTVPATRVTVMGQPLILESSMGLGVAADQARQGPVSVLVVQKRVQAL